MLHLFLKPLTVSSPFCFHDWILQRSGRSQLRQWLQELRCWILLPRLGELFNAKRSCLGGMRATHVLVLSSSRKQEFYAQRDTFAHTRYVIKSPPGCCMRIVDVMMDSESFLPCVVGRSRDTLPTLHGRHTNPFPREVRLYRSVCSRCTRRALGGLGSLQTTQPRVCSPNGRYARVEQSCGGQRRELSQSKEAVASLKAQAGCP
jgi:hypothetical protein